MAAWELVRCQGVGWECRAGVLNLDFGGDDQSHMGGAAVFFLDASVFVRLQRMARPVWGFAVRLSISGRELPLQDGSNPSLDYFDVEMGAPPTPSWSPAVRPRFMKQPAWRVDCGGVREWKNRVGSTLYVTGQPRPWATLRPKHAGRGLGRASLYGSFRARTSPGHFLMSSWSSFVLGRLARKGNDVRAGPAAKYSTRMIMPV